MCACVYECMHTGNSNNQFSIDRQTGLVTRGLNPLDRETKSSHVLDVEAYNSDEGSMRSSVRVSKKITSGGVMDRTRRDAITCTFPTCTAYQMGSILLFRNTLFL